VPPHLCLLSLPPGPTRQPHAVHRIVFLPRPLTPIPFSDRAPTALAGAGEEVTLGAWPCLLGAASTQPLAVIGCKLTPPITLDPHPPITSHPPLELGAPAIKAPALVAQAHSRAYRHLATTPLHTRAKRESQERKKEGRWRKKEAPTKHRRSHRSKDDATTLHGMTRLPKLHGLEPPLHHHPITFDTNGEPPPGLSLLAAGPHQVGHGAPHRERVGQGRLWPLGTHAPTRTPATTP